MCFSYAFLIPALLLSALPGRAQAPVQPALPPSGAAAAAAADPYRNESIVLERVETTYRMHADGTGERDIHVVARIQSDGAAQEFGVLSFSYASTYETPVIKFVRVHKPDGATVETPASDAIDMPADVTRQAPLYSDLKEKHLPVRSLARGDKLEYEVGTLIQKPEAPDQFWGAAHFTPPGSVVVLAEVLNLEVPADKYVQVWSPNHKPAITEKNGLRTCAWTVAQLVTAPKATGDGPKPVAPRDPDEDSDGRKLPSVAWTTFHSWSEVGDWYRSLARFEAAGAKSGATRPAEALQALRTFKIPRPDGVKGWGAFRLEITTTGVIESQQMTGQKQLEAVTKNLEGFQFPELLPPGSKAHLLRSAVISCTSGKTCEVVLVPDGGLQTEMQ